LLFQNLFKGVEKMKILLTAMISTSFVLGMGMIGLIFLFGKMALAYAKKE